MTDWKEADMDEKFMDECKLRQERMNAINRTPEEIISNALDSAISIMNDIADICEEKKDYDPIHMLRSWAKRCQLAKQVAEEKRDHDMSFVWNGKRGTSATTKAAGEDGG